MKTRCVLSFIPSIAVKSKESLEMTEKLRSEKEYGGRRERRKTGETCSGRPLVSPVAEGHGGGGEN